MVPSQDSKSAIPGKLDIPLSHLTPSPGVILCEYVGELYITKTRANEHKPSVKAPSTNVQSF